jgi:hypothetical protein
LVSAKPRGPSMDSSLYTLALVLSALSMVAVVAAVYLGG